MQSDQFLSSRLSGSTTTSPVQYKLTAGAQIHTHSTVRRDSYTNISIDEQSFSPPVTQHAAISPVKPSINTMQHYGSELNSSEQLGHNNIEYGDENDDDELLNTLNDKENVRINTAHSTIPTNNKEHDVSTPNKSIQRLETFESLIGPINRPSSQYTPRHNDNVQYNSRNIDSSNPHVADVLDEHGLVIDSVPYDEYDDLAMRYDRLNDELFELRKQNTSLRKQASDALHINNNIQFHNRIAELESELHHAAEENKTLQNEVRKLSKAMQQQANEISNYPTLINALQNTITSNELKIKAQVQAINQYEIKSRKQHEYCVSLEQRCRKLQDANSGVRTTSKLLTSYSSQKQLNNNMATNSNKSNDSRPATSFTKSSAATSTLNTGRSDAVRSATNNSNSKNNTSSTTLSRQSSQAQIKTLNRHSSHTTLSRQSSIPQYTRQSSKQLADTASTQSISQRRASLSSKSNKSMVDPVPVIQPSSQRRPSLSTPLVSLSSALPSHTTLSSNKPCTPTELSARTPVLVPILVHHSINTSNTQSDTINNVNQISNNSTLHSSVSSSRTNKPNTTANSSNVSHSGNSLPVSVSRTNTIHTPYSIEPIAASIPHITSLQHNIDNLSTIQPQHTVEQAVILQAPTSVVAPRADSIASPRVTESSSLDQHITEPATVGTLHTETMISSHQSIHDSPLRIQPDLLTQHSTESSAVISSSPSNNVTAQPSRRDTGFSLIDASEIPYVSRVDSMLHDNQTTQPIHSIDDDQTNHTVAAQKNEFVTQSNTVTSTRLDDNDEFNDEISQLIDQQDTHRTKSITNIQAEQFELSTQQGNTTARSTTSQFVINDNVQASDSEYTDDFAPEDAEFV